MPVLGTTNISLNSAQQLYGVASGTQRSMGDTNIRYLAGIPLSTSTSQINLNKLSGAGYFTKTSAGAAVNIRADCVASGWNQSGPVWYVITGNTYSGSTGSPALTISGSFPGGIILQINSGVYVVGKGGAGGTGGIGSGAGTGGAVGGVALAVSGYTGSTLYINNLGILSGGGGGGGAGRGGYTASGYSATNYQGGGGGGGTGFGAGGANAGGTGTISAGGSGGAAVPGAATVGATAGAAGGGLGAAGTASFYAAGAAGACTTGTVAASVNWIAIGTRYGTVG
jgi:hypothetical protein